MKKSEALQVIKEYLDINNNILNPEQILAIIEKIGMNPPALDSKRYKALYSVYIEPSPYMWEEDFEKDKKVLEVYNK